MGRIHLRQVKKAFGEVTVIPPLDLEIEDGEFVVFVGPSGCGKSTLLRLIAGLEDTTSGNIEIDGQDATGLPPAKRGLAMVFQSYALYPHMSVRKNIAFPLRMAKMSQEEQDRRIEAAARSLNLTDYLDRRPGQLSGGQRQRVAIARALAPEPKLIIADEPVSALDVSIQSQILNLLKDLTKRMGLTMIFISHDLSVVRYIADRIAVMYLGKIIELGSAEDIVDNPLHIYTRALMSAIPRPDPRLERTRSRIVLEGDPPSPLDPPSGCNFWPRSPVPHDDYMKSHVPEFAEIIPGHFAANCPFCLQKETLAKPVD